LSELSQKLDVYLATKELSKRQLALELDISINTLEKWWRNREPSAEHATRILQLLQEEDSDAVAVSQEGPASPASQTDVPKVVPIHVTTGMSKQGKRHEERPAVVSLLRTRCPFCEHAIERFRSCPDCGQHFVWANVPMDG